MPLKCDESDYPKITEIGNSPFWSGLVLGGSTLRPVLSYPTQFQAHLSMLDFQLLLPTRV